MVDNSEAELFKVLKLMSFLDKNFWKYVNIIAKLIILKNWEPKHATICCLSISVSVKVKEGGGCTLGN